ncbi:hypothetical protein EUBSIR_00880 [[Eubacterium] siraeum DSM 15702]|uniref:Uncharacterized protein n=1 Tax=[Eubacterium] siraeum DSM 15702 TaxID=428128 RepID=B0MM31_9FIRM|nr:hypothetical protein EUBSIR_00880 [[Eubacterium] siraeum DSM 15702]
MHTILIPYAVYICVFAVAIYMHGYSARVNTIQTITAYMLQSTCTGIVQVQFQTGTSCFSFVAIYMHGYSARAALKIWQKVTQVAIYMHGYSARRQIHSNNKISNVAIYMHGYSASIESSERSASIRVAIYMQGYSASQTAYFGYIPFVKLQSTCMGIAQAVERKCFL